MSVRSTIYDNLLARLALVTVANGYNTNVISPIAKNVLHSEVDNIKLGSARVSVLDDVDSEPIQYATANRVLLEASFVVRAQIGAVNFGLVPSTATNNFVADMHKARRLIKATPSLLHANVYTCQLAAVPGANVADDSGIVAVTFLVTYWIDESAP